MFGGKKPSAEVAFDNEGHDQVYEYRAIVCMGINAFNKDVDTMARKGWELINGCMAGTAHYGYLRRKLQP